MFVYNDDVMSTAASHIDRILEPLAEAFTPTLAQKLVELRADEEFTNQIEYLRRGANEGTLTPEEAADYKGMVHALDVVSVLQLKARRFLQQHAS